jgi:hypothetical protein
LTWLILNLYVVLCSIPIEKLSRGQNDATRARAAVAAGRAGVWAWAWRGRRRACRAETYGRRGCGTGRDGTEWERFSTSFLMRRVPISAKALRRLDASAPLPLLTLGPWLTRELLYTTSSGLVPRVEITQNNLLQTEIPIPWLARTGPWESRSLWDVRRIRSSPARVKTAITFWGVLPARLLAASSSCS